MHLVETYSHFCGIKPGQPFIDTNYSPVPFDKYIVIHGKTGMATKDYDLWEEILEHINVPTVLVGGKDDPKLSVSLNLCGQTSWTHTAYLIKNAAMFIGADSVCAHIASSFGVKSVVLFGGTSPLSCGAYWNKDKVITLNPVDRYGCDKPCHSAQCIRPKKCINSIRPETVLKYIGSFLGEDAVRKVEILHIGDMSKVGLIEWVPTECNQDVYNILRGCFGTISVRADLCKPDMSGISAICNGTNAHFVVMAHPSDIPSFNVHPDKVEQLLILVDSSNIVDGIKALKEATKKHYKARLISRQNHTDFNDYKLDILDYPPMIKLSDFTYTKDDELKYLGKSLFVKSAKRILGAGAKFYLTTFDATKGQNSLEFNSNCGILTLEESHLKELQFLIIRKYE